MFRAKIVLIAFAVGWMPIPATGLAQERVQKALPVLKSGPQVGSENDRDGFRPRFVAGPSAGKNLCPV
jgi:hypothetical protein